jgi:hypothetical protein
MLELAMVIAAVVIMYRIAEMDNWSGVLCGGLTALACIVAMFTIPFPLVRIALVAAGMFVAMFVCRLVANK